jgi:hypothetical protein
MAAELRPAQLGDGAGGGSAGREGGEVAIAEAEAAQGLTAPS